LFGTSAEFWLNLQILYEPRLARHEIGGKVDKLPRLKGRKPGRAPATSRRFPAR